ncbi:putative WRKY transcription factor 54 [Raphanus sativus]|uniref:Probable WRKY transcription factor 54 n=1 Tax=Raphanus sativus TaxID=3726 RepID=A0A6J0JHP3_RAPSA|nr:probable WRKY transcription factor 54 [Raphanus sativus]KAJ4892068.1 putative WRKY transcription factor 54 [Raphanus sativus]
MDSNSNNTKSIKRKVVDQLVEGYEFATKLQLLLSHQHSNHHIDHTRIVSCDPDPVGELIAKILASFHKTISVLDSCESLPMAVEGSLNASCGDDLTAPASCNGGDYVDSRKRLGAGKGKRGCYTRKKRWHTWTVEARRIDEDKYAWRKYGQKEILNTKFPRSYFRCTHKPTQGCKATKHVQKHEQDPDLFQITYIGHHTCNVRDQTQENTEPFDHGVVMDSNNTLAATIAQDHVNADMQEEEINISSLIVVGADMVKEEDHNNGDQNKDYCEGSSANGDLSLVWQDMMMLDDQQHHQNQYYNGEANTGSHQFAFIDNDQLSSLFDSYCPYEGTSAI